MFLISILLLGFAFFLLPKIELFRFVKISDPKTIGEILPTTQAMLITFGLGLPSGLMQRIFNGYQEGYAANLYLAVGRLLGLFGLLVCIKFESQLPMLASVMLGAPFVSLTLGGFALFHFKRPWLRPSLKYVTWRDVKKISNIGLLAFAAQLGSQIILLGPALVITNQIGAVGVAVYSVTQKIITFPSMLLLMLITPIWPAYGEAFARGDIVWVKNTFMRTIKMGATLSIPSFVILAVFGQRIILLWTGKIEVVPDMSLLLACNIWAIVLVWIFICCTLLNGLSLMKGQATYGVVIPLFSIWAGYLVADYSGVSGVLWYGVVCGEILRALFLTIEVKRVIVKMDQSNSNQVSLDQNVITFWRKGKNEW